MEGFKKVVLSLDFHDDKKCKQRAMKIVAGVPGVNEISMDTKERKLTIIGSMDEMNLVTDLRKVYRTKVITIGPAKEPEKPKEKPNKEEPPNQAQMFLEPCPYHMYPFPWGYCYTCY